LFFFSNGQIALGLLAPDHLRQDTCSPCRHQPHHRPIRIFGWMDSYAVLAAALVFIPSLWRSRHTITMQHTAVLDVHRMNRYSKVQVITDITWMLCTISPRFCQTVKAQ